jgi:hypothetical protein
MFLIDGLTLVCMSGTALLLVVFIFLFFAEKSVHKPH